LKFPELPELKDYNGCGNDIFWENFPFTPLPTVADTQINVQALEAKVNKVKNSLTVAQLKRAGRVVEYLKFGAPAHQDKVLGPCHVENSGKTIKNGVAVTDNIATWLSKKYAAGPFDRPPCPLFRTNQLLAVVQPSKVRPVLNVSLPKEESFNSNIKKNDLEKVKMSSASEFAVALHKSGKGATMSKFDLVAAYKQVPCKIEDLRLQGFMWLQKYFCETRQIFGASTSVCNFDMLGETIKAVALAESNIPHGLVMRQVDDVPIVAPKGSGWCEEYSEIYKKTCSDLSVELAPNCPSAEKAFENVTEGKVLGVLFNSERMEWSLPQDKRSKTLRSVAEIFHGEKIHLKRFQKLMGRLNHVCQMCDFMKIFTTPLNESLAGIATDAHPNTPVTVSEQAKSDLRVWAGFLSENRWLPVPAPDDPPARFRKEVVSDAAGTPEGHTWKEGTGCGGVALYEDGTIAWAFRHSWEESFLEMKDEKGTRYGDKTTCLEALGMLLPLLSFPAYYKNSTVIAKVDCLGVVFGMWNKHSKGDKTASVIIRAMHLIASFLECRIVVEHLPRKSDWDSDLADRLSRTSTMNSNDKKLIAACPPLRVPKCLSNWFKNPSSNWNLATDLLKSAMYDS
jgi:hypothetical protein